MYQLLIKSKLWAASHQLWVSINLESRLRLFQSHDHFFSFGVTPAKPVRFVSTAASFPSNQLSFLNGVPILPRSFWPAGVKFPPDIRGVLLPEAPRNFGVGVLPGTASPFTSPNLPVSPLL